MAALGSSMLLAACGGSEFTSDGVGGAGGDAASSGGSGSGASAGCGGPDDCPGQDLQCIKRTCEAGVCGVMNVTIGEPTAQQYVGDCQTIRCDGQGSTISDPDASDVFDDGDECTLDSCDSGMPTNDIAVGAHCTTPKDASGKCTVLGICLQCVLASDCIPGREVCVHGQCVSPLCDNDMTDPGETDLNCGGPDCPPCMVGDECDVAADCVSGVCDDTCQAPACNDGTQNGGETGKDCGGPACPACGAGQGCMDPSDCKSGVCIGGSCNAPSCVDGVANGTESDKDCGGNCPDCPLGDTCNGDGDCQSQYCPNGACADRCSNNTHDGQETDADCGGPICDPCSVGSLCVCEPDCESGICCVLSSGETMQSVCAGDASQCTDPDPICF
jgi:hypothetical protein